MTESKNSLEYYQDSAGEWRWRVRSIANGEIVDASSEGFVSKEKARQNFSLSRDAVE